MLKYLTSDELNEESVGIHMKISNSDVLLREILNRRISI